MQRSQYPSIAGNLLWNVLTVTGQQGTLSAPSATGAFQLQPSATADPATGEAAIVFSSTVNGATTRLSWPAAAHPRMAGAVEPTATLEVPDEGHNS